MAFIDDHEPVPVEQRASVWPACDRLEGGDIDDAARFRGRSDTADLSTGEAEVQHQLRFPSLRKLRSLDKDQRRHLALRDQRSGDHGLAAPVGATRTACS